MQLSRDPDGPTITARLDRATSLGELFLATAATRLEKPALIAHESGVEWTFGQLLARTGEVARRLQSLGIVRGDPVALTSAFHADLGDTTLRNAKVPVLLGKLGLARVQDDQEIGHFAGEA